MPPDARRQGQGTPQIADRLQPSLLDRLLDDQPAVAVEPREARVLTRQALRAVVLRDLAWLLNTQDNSDRINASRYPHASVSVLNYGLPSLAGRLASTVDTASLEESLRQAIVRFEPRLLPESVEVEAVLDRSVLDMHNQIGLIVRGLLWAQPIPLEFVLRTDIDLEEGKVNVVELRR